MSDIGRDLGRVNDKLTKQSEQESECERVKVKEREREKERVSE